MMRLTIAAAAAILATTALGQEKPELIPTKELPPSAVCAYCVALGTMMTPAKPTHGVRFRGKRYFFHDKSMYDAFMKDPDAYSDPVLPRPMPKTVLTTSTGTKVDDSFFKGKMVLVDFWATWCEPCKKMSPILDDVLAAYKVKGLEMLSVSEDQKRKDYDKFIKEKPFGHAVAFDDKKAFASWHVVTIPALFLVKDGQIIAQWVGFTDKAPIEEAVKKAIGTAGAKGEVRR